MQQAAAKLRQAVAAGELSREEAMQKMMMLRKKMMSSQRPVHAGEPWHGKPQSSHGKPQEKNSIEHHAHEDMLKIRKAVAAGELSREEAAKKIAAVQMRIKASQAQPSGPAGKPAQQRPQPGVAPKQAPQSNQAPQTRVDFDIRTEGGKIWLELRKAVEAGEITREQAIERFNQWRARQGDSRSDAGRPTAKPVQAAPLVKPKTQSIPATKVQPSKVFQLPPEKSDQ